MMTKLEENDWKALVLLFLLCNINTENIKRIKIGILEDNKELRNLIQENINKLQEELKDE